MSELTNSPDSQTHRLCFFKHAPLGEKHVAVPHFVADEVEEYREFLRFLYPQRGQDRFRLNRPDLLQPEWSVSSKVGDSLVQYAAGETALEAVRHARIRLQHEGEDPRHFQLKP